MGQAIEFTWTDVRETATVAELARACGLTADELRELADYGALRPLPSAGSEPVFSADALPVLREAARLRRDFDLDLFAVAILVGYLERIEALERQVHSLQAHMPLHMPFNMPGAHREGPQPWREPHG
jgi:chaperone modulatory protein CbpM